MPPSVPVVSLEGDYGWCTVAYLNLNNCLRVPVHLDYIFFFIVPEKILMGSGELSFMFFPYYTHLISLHCVYPCLKLVIHVKYRKQLKLSKLVLVLINQLRDATAEKSPNIF